MSAEQNQRQLEWLSSLKSLDSGKVLSSCTQAILEELEKEDTSIQKVSDLLALEPALSAKLLMIANSPFFGFHREIQDVEEAIVVLGAVKLNTLVYSSLVLVNAEDRKHQSYIKHSLVTALYAKRIAEAMAMKPHICFTAGLFHVLPIILNFQSDIQNILNMKVLKLAAHSVLHNLQLPEAIIQTATDFYNPNTNEENTLVLRMAFNLSVIRLGKEDAPFKQLIDIEHDFNKLSFYPESLADVYYSGISESQELMSLAGWS